MTEPLLSVRNVTRVYGPPNSVWVHALDGIELDIYDGEFVAIVGPSGGGKSTLLSILGLLDEPSSGEYLVSGRSTRALREGERTRLRSVMFGFVFQAFHLLGHRPVLDSAELALLYQGASRPSRQQAAQRALSDLGIGEKSNDLALEMSGGQQQRVAIARAVAASTPVILADEPTGNLDSVSGAAVLEKLEELNRTGTTVIVVTHSHEVAERAQRIVRLVDGRIISDSRETRNRQHVRASKTENRGVAGPKAVASRLTWREIIRDAWKSVISRRGQSIGLLCAVALAVGMMIVTFGISASAKAQVSSEFDLRANKEVTVRWDEASRGPVSNVLSRIEVLSGISSAAVLSDHGEIEVSSQDASFSVTLQGATGELDKPTVSAISWVQGAKNEVGPGEAVVGRSLARQLALPPLALSPQIMVGGAFFTVVGIIGESQRFPLLAGQIVLTEAEASAQAPAVTHTLAIVTTPGAAGQVGHLVSRAIDPSHPDEFVVDVPVDPKSLRQSIEGGVEIALFSFTALAAVVAILTLANAITLSVASRRGEFGLRRAVGARASHLAALVSSESAIIGVAGGVTGLVTGVLAILAFTISQRWLPVFDLWLAPLAILAGILLATLSSVVGAIRAANVSPAEALRA